MTTITPPSSDLAIKAALSKDWKEAIHINTALLKMTPNDAEIHTRLGFAYMQSGQFSQAKKSFQKALKIDPYNQIAERNSKRLTHLKLKDVQDSSPAPSTPLTFIEEPGKTKIVSCINLAPANTLSRLTAGLHVYLKPKKHCVEVRTHDDTHIGALPDDVSFRLIKLIEGGNTYVIFIKSVSKKQLILFIRETSRGEQFANQPSFIASHQYLAGGTRDTGTTDDSMDTTATGEDKEDLPPADEPTA